MNQLVLLVFFLLLVVHLCSGSFKSPVEPRVIGGWEVKIRDFAYHAGVWVFGPNIQNGQEEGQDWEHICGAVIITDSWVVTAGHCCYIFPSYINIYRANRYRVSAGRDKIALASQFEINNFYQVRRVIPYSDRLFKDKIAYEFHDIALFEMKHPFPFSEFIQPAILPKPDYHIRFESQACVVGHGVTKPMDYDTKDKLWMICGIIGAANECWDTRKNSSMRAGCDLICLRNVHTKTSSVCQSDSGSGLMKKADKEAKDFILIGIAAHVHRQCQRGSSSDMFTHVANHSTWIQSHVCPDGRHPCRFA